MIIYQIYNIWYNFCSKDFKKSIEIVNCFYNKEIMTYLKRFTNVYHKEIFSYQQIYKVIGWWWRTSCHLTLKKVPYYQYIEFFFAYFYDIFDRFDCFESIFDSDFSEIFIIFFILFKYFFDDYKARMFVMKKMQIFISSFLVIIDFISSSQSSKNSSIVSIGLLHFQ